MKKEWLGCRLVAVCFFALGGMTAGAERAGIPNASFEAGGPAPEGWTITGDGRLDSGEKIAGERSLRLRRDPMNLPATGAVSERFEIAPGVWELTGAVKNELHSPDLSFNVSVAMRFLDASGRELKRRRVLAISGTGAWKRCEERFDVPAGTSEAAVAIEFNKTHGDFRIDDLALTYVGESVPMDGGDRKTVFTSQRTGHLFYPSDDVVVEMALDTPAVLEGGALDFAWELTDFGGERQAAVQAGKLAPDGKAPNGWNRYRARLDLRQLPVKQGRYYEIRTSTDLGASSRAKDRMSFAVLPEAATFGYDPMEIPFGAHTWNTTVYEFYPLAARLGLRRSLCFWRWPETPPYTPEFDGHAYDSRIGWPKQFGMRPWGIVYPAMNVEHAEGEPYTDEALREGMRQSVEKYTSQGVWGYQIGNEPPSGNPEMVKRDVEMYKLLYETIKKANPDVVVIGSAIGPNEAFFKAGFQPYQDVYNIHGYNDLGELRENMRRYRELFAKYGGEKPIWSTEIGSNSQGLTRDVIAKDLIRKAVSFFADGGGFFCWFAVGGMPNPDGERSGGYSDSMDLFDGKYDMHLPRLDAVAYYHIINGILVKKFVREISYPEGVNGFLFRDDSGNCLLVFWGEGTDGDWFISLPDVRDVDVTHYDGRSIRLDGRGKGINLRITSDPVLLTFRGEADSIPEKLEPAAVSAVEIPADLTQGGTATIAVKVGRGEASSRRPLQGEDALEREASLRRPLRGDLREEVSLAGPALWRISGPLVAEEPDGSARVAWEVTVPDDSPERMATFQVSNATPDLAGDTELLFQVPVRSRIELDINPLAGMEDGKAKVQIVLTNHSDTEQAVSWKAELLSEMPMKSGTYDLKGAGPATAFFADAAKDQVRLGPRESQTITLGLDKVDRLAIYKIRATAFDANGNPVTRERFVGGFAAVPKAKAKLVLDGNLGDPDWKSAPAYRIDEARQIFYAKKEAKEWSGAEDLSGTVRFLWDEEHLYIGVEVRDDVFANPMYDMKIWNQDGLQFLINPHRQAAQGKGRYDYSMGLGQKGPQAWCHLSADSKAPAGEAAEIRVATARPGSEKGDMAYEAAIPWQRLAPFQPRPGNNLGLAMILNEDDGSGRKSFMGWFSGVHLKETDFVGDLILEE